MPQAKAPAHAKGNRPVSNAALLRAATCGKGDHDWHVKAKMGSNKIVTKRCARCHAEYREAAHA